VAYDAVVCIVTNAAKVSISRASTSASLSLGSGVKTHERGGFEAVLTASCVDFTVLSLTALLVR